MPHKLRILLGNALAGSLDLCVGVLVAAATLSYFGLKPALWELALGALLAVLPDFDIIPGILMGREGMGNHRVSLMHRPLVVLPLSAALAYALGGLPWLVVALVCITWHYLHDTPPLSLGGIAWFWPLDKRYWSWFGPKAPVNETGLSHEQWLEKYWLQPSYASVMEVSTGIIALIVASIIAWL